MKCRGNVQGIRNEQMIEDTKERRENKSKYNRPLFSFSHLSPVVFKIENIFHKKNASLQTNGSEITSSDEMTWQA